MVNTAGTAAGTSPDLQDSDKKLKAKVKKRESDEASAQIKGPSEQENTEQSETYQSYETGRDKKKELKDLQRLPKEMQIRIATLAAKKTSQERRETITKVLGTGWETAPTVRMELTEERLNEILAGMCTEDTPSKPKSIP